MSDAASAQLAASLPRSTQRTDSWWLQPAVTFAVLSAFVAYGLWRTFENAHYYSAPYLAPFYSPCLSLKCDHVTLPLVGNWFTLSPALLVLWAPVGIRLTCYYYRKAYYRSFWLAPPACAVPDAKRGYTGETGFPLILQNIHRYFFYFARVVIGFLWWDAIQSFRFPSGPSTPTETSFGIGVGTIILVVNASLLTLYSLSCHSCRHLCGGRLDLFSKHPLRYRLWKLVTPLNQRHTLIAWTSMFGVVIADYYVRLVSLGVIHDLRIL